MTVEIWTAADTNSQVVLPHRPLGEAMKRGLLCRCPSCGRGKLFGNYLKVVPACASCGEDLSHERADDAPPYFTILLVGHIIVPLVLFVETRWQPDLVLQMAVWLPLTVLLALAFLQPIKGAIVGYQWAHYMHGFDPNGGDDDDKTYRPSGSRDVA